jgi:hypothetical protein
VRESVSETSAFLGNELNLDSFKEYLKWRFPDRVVESWNGQSRLVLDGLLAAGYKTLGDVETALSKTSDARAAVVKEIGPEVEVAKDGTVPSNLEPGLALGLLAPNWKKLIPVFPRTWVNIIGKRRARKKGSR